MGVKEWEKRMKMYKSFYSFKVMHATLGMNCGEEKIKGRKQKKQGKGEK